MTSDKDYLDLSSLSNVAEPLVDTVESEDFTTRQVQPVGEYISEFRSITARKKDDGHYSFLITFEGGLRNVANGRVYGDRFPLKKFITTTPFKQKDRDGNEFPGTTSSVAEYLRRCGLNPKGLDINGLLAAMGESQSIPVGVFVGRTDKAVKGADGRWSNVGLKTADFNTGTKDAPVYVDSVTLNDVTYAAVPTVVSFHSIKS